MSVSRLLRFPIILVSRTDSGSEDSWGSPILTETETETLCYYRQTDTSDSVSNVESSPIMEAYEVFLLPSESLGPYDAVKIDVGHGYLDTFEVIGQPAPEQNARTGKTNHLRMTVRRAAP